MGWMDDWGDWMSSNIPVVGPVVGGFFQNPSRPYNTAAAGARDVSGQARDFSNQQWQRQMEGLNQALGMYGGSRQAQAGAQGYWDSTYGSQGPGALQNWYQQYGGKFGDQTATQGAMQDWQSYMKYNPGGQTRNARDTAVYQMGDNRSADLYGQQQQQLGGPGGYENWANTLSNTMRGMQSSYDKEAEKWRQGLEKTGRAEAFQVQAPSMLQAFASSLPQMQGTAQIEASAPELQNTFRGANMTSRYAGSQMPQLQGPGAYEQFVTQDIYGTNPAMERAKSQGLARINQEMARRGAFKSGAADTAIGNFLGEMEAKEYDQRAQRAQAAQGMQLSRIGAGSALGQAADTTSIQRGGALQGLAQGRDVEKRSRLDQILAATQAASGENLAGQRLGLDAATAADASRNARIGLGAHLAGQGADRDLAYRQFEGQTQAQAQRMGMDRLAQMMAGAGQGDQMGLARAAQTFGMGRQMDEGTRDQYALLAQLAGAQDQGALARLMGSAGVAGNVQQLGDARTEAANQARMQLLASQFGIDNAMAGQVGGFYGQGGQLAGQSMSDAFNALMNYYQLMAQGQAAQGEYPFKVANTGIQAYKAKQGIG